MKEEKERCIFCLFNYALFSITNVNPVKYYTKLNNNCLGLMKRNEMEI